jgi:hypothetical protein
MQIVEINLENINFYCPVTGEYILKVYEPVNEDASSLMAYWIDLAFEDPFIKSEKLQAAWNTFCENYAKENNDDYPDIEAFEGFISNLKWNNWVCFKLTENGMACGPTSSTVWKILDLGINVSTEDQ